MGNLNDAPLRTSVPTPSPNSPAASAVSLTTPLRELCQERQESWVERIFVRMSAMYGRLFAEMWAGVDPAEVKATWIDDLAPFCGQQIAWAMEQCKSRDLPPTLPMFRSLCQQAPRPAAPALPAPVVPVEEAQRRVQEASAKALAPRPDGLAWARVKPASAEAWEASICELAAAGDERFLAILSDHWAAGLIRSARARQILMPTHDAVA